MPNIILLGKSAVGKSTMENLLCENLRYTKSVSCTTRPKREGEVNGKDYYFISEDEFNLHEKSGDFLETAEYRGWKYGTLKNELNKDKNMVFVLNPEGFRQFEENNIEAISFMIHVEPTERMIRQLLRGDDPAEVVRRFTTDNRDFVGVTTDYEVSNDTDRYECLLEILEDIFYYYSETKYDEEKRTIRSKIEEYLNSED